MKRVEVAIVGGGPAGLAAAIEAARRGLQVLVVDRQAGAPDKACGEGLMPAGAQALAALGVKIPGGEGAPFLGIRYLQAGCSAEARFHDGAGLGLRRLVLAEALHRAAIEAGVEVRRGVTASAFRFEAERVAFQAEEEIEARVLVVADGLASPLRHELGLDLPQGKSRRFGLRRHYRGVVPPDFVEVHWADGLEAYLTPVGPGRMGVAFLFESREGEKPDFEAFLDRVPAVRERLAGGQLDSELRGAGPLARRASAVVKGRVALLGDAAGYVDAITGEGLTLAFASACSLAEALPAAVARDGGVASLQDYARVHRRLFRRYALTAGGLLWLSRRAALRRWVVQMLSNYPSLFAGALRIVT